MPLGMEVRVSLRDFVLDGDPAPSQKVPVVTTPFAAV